MKDEEMTQFVADEAVESKINIPAMQAPHDSSIAPQVVQISNVFVFVVLREIRGAFNRSPRQESWQFFYASSIPHCNKFPPKKLDYAMPSKWKCGI
jgi:hypothetical protein